MLLREIHHRVGNNMQLISGLLALQSRQSQFPEVAEAFQISQNRIRAMTLVHQELYQSEQIEYLNVDKYLKSIAEALSQAYGRKDIHFEIKSAVVNVGLDTAIPLSLIVTEITSNALKHAFPDGRTGAITIELSVSDGNMAVLTISDNGIGTPETLDYRNSPSMGLQIVTMLVTRIKGTLEMHRNNGTTFTITFRLAEEFQKTALLCQ